MTSDQRAQLAAIRTFDQLIGYLRDWMSWPIDGDDLEELTFEYTPEELGIDPKSAAKILGIKRLRPLSAAQPWGIFFVEFEPKQLPVLALRRILSRVALKKRASANRADQVAWAADDLLFISAHGAGDDRQLTFAHFAPAQDGRDLPTLKVLGWDSRDTALHLDGVARELTENLAWPDDEDDAAAWRTTWRGAFTLGHREVVTTSKDLAIRLAALARRIRDRIKYALAIETETGPLTKLMKAFREALIHDLDADGFADMYAQTIAYGLLSARITDPKRSTLDDFAAHMRTNPFLRELMEAFLEAGGRRGKAGQAGLDFDELGFSDVVGLLDRAKMDAVVQDFGDQNPQEDPVIHFYELFLKEYDAKKRMQRGVFYTPRPVVSYIVRSVDELLRTEFGLEDGLADTTSWGEMAKRHEDLTIPEGVSPEQDFVQILDPATGTGTFLVEVIDLIHKTLVAKWKAQGHGAKQINVLWNAYVPKHLLTRLHGYELLMAPYAIAHLKIGLKLYETGYRFGSDERARVYLTNALEPPQDFSGQFEFVIPALAHEANAVNLIKQASFFTAVIGNPPYSVKSYNNGAWIRSLLNDFKYGLNEQKINLDDDYIKFLRLLTHLGDVTKASCFGMITNSGFLSGVTHRQMRSRLMKTFDSIQITDLHGDSRYGETAPSGRKNENVFDIQQGVCVSMFVGCPWRRDRRISLVDIWGSRPEKYEMLLSKESIEREQIEPMPPLFLFHKASTAFQAEYSRWPSITEWMPISSNGIETHQDRITLHFTPQERDSLIAKLVSMPVDQARADFGIGNDGRDWSLEGAIQSLRCADHDQIIKTPITYRPFDIRHTVLNRKSGGFLAYPRWDIMSNMVLVENNVGLVTARLMARGGCWDSCIATRYPTEKKAGDSTRSSALFPLFVKDADFGGQSAAISTNFSALVLEKLRKTGMISNFVDEDTSSREIFAYLFGLLNSGSYRSRYASQLRTGFPRLPIPTDAELFQKVARVGARLVALQLLEGILIDSPRCEFHGEPRTVQTVGWVPNSGGTVWIDRAYTSKSCRSASSGFSPVPEDVWNFHIGGYQVCAKWLKDRRGRTLSDEDIAHYQKIVVAIAETIRLMAEIDAVIEEHGGWPGAFATGDSAEA